MMANGYDTVGYTVYHLIVQVGFIVTTRNRNSVEQPVQWQPGEGCSFHDPAYCEAIGAYMEPLRCCFFFLLFSGTLF